MIGFTLVDSVWTLVSDGTSDVLVQAQGSDVGLSNGDASPVDGAPSIIIPNYGMLNVKAPNKLWARAHNSYLVVVPSS